MRIYTLTTISGQNGIVTTVHTSEGEAYDTLRRNFAAHDDVPNERLFEHVQDTGTMVDISPQDVESPAHVLLVGNPVDGVKLYAVEGPDDPRIENVFSSREWWVAEVNIID